jgi:hypothetical protein
MIDIIIQIMVEILSILGIATKEIKQSRLSKYSVYKYITVNFTISLSEKIAKKLIGRTDMENVLNRLEKLTYEEAWMGIAQNLKATHTVVESVRKVDDRVRVVDDRVTEFIRGA